MLACKITVYTVLFIAVVSCVKQGAMPAAPGKKENTNINAQRLQPYNKTIFGLMEENCTISHTQKRMDKAGLPLVRVPIFLSETPTSKEINNYLNEGYNVQINANWYNDLNGKRTFPSDTNFLKSQAKAFFKYYKPFKSQVVFVAVENEWDYEAMYGSNIQDYLTELSILTRIGHRHGFKIADGGITSTALQRWTYSQLSGDAQQEWRKNYYIGLNNNYDSLMDIINTYTTGVKNISFDYSNVHWYNSMKCSNGFSTACDKFMAACDKKMVVCNEFGIRTNALTLFDSTADEIRGNAKYAVAYSGSDSVGKAVKLTDKMLGLLY